MITIIEIFIVDIISILKYGDASHSSLMLGVARGSIDPSLGNDLSACSRTGKCVAENPPGVFRVWLISSTRSLHFATKVCLKFFNQRPVDPDHNFNHDHDRV
jgi:hypothetical protein